MSSFLIMMVLMFGVLYFIMIRPQQKRAKEHQNMIGSLKRGDQVVTRGGVIGRVSGVTDTEVVLEVQEKVRIRVLKTHVESKYGEKTAVREPTKAETKPEAPTETKN